ncbi:MAG: glycoside hydrolase family 31 protein [Actinomycetota bacterium]|nr:glycoside hydrolase family 31 protein [Actinomycetota bacterium]
MTETFERRPKTGGEYRPLGPGELLDHDDRGLRVKSGLTTVEVTALAPDLFRVGMFPEGRPPRYDSEAIAKEDWDPVEISMQESEEELTLSTTAATARISLQPLRVGFRDASGRTFAADDEELGMGAVETPGADVFSQPLGSPVRLYKKRAEGERYFGCGERTSGLEKTGSRQVFYNVDPPSGHTASFNNLYTSIPFTLSMTNGVAHGLLFDNTHRVEFDLALEDEGRAYYGAEGGNVVYYVFCGPTPREVVDRYTELTGCTPMPPLWALGNQQCRYSYMDEEEVREVARGFRERDIPCDVIYLDIHYMDGYRVFTWDRERFPDPEKLISDLREEGFRVVTIVDPGVKADESYLVYVEGRERDLYCKTQSGAEYHNVVWPGTCAFPDFTNPETRAWWGENHKVLTDAGVAGIWCDMNEPALFVPKQSTMPDDVVHPGGGEPRWHAQIHNTYGSLMARAAREGLLALRPGERPFVITRAGYAGLQRHALQWTGDNSSWWEHLWMSMPQLQNLGLSGIAWSGVDVGGFFGDTNGELLARWTEFGIFQPFCRNHSAIGTRRQEPWAFGEPYESVCRQMIKLRQRLLPYLYTLFEECHRTGAPILRPLLFEYPEDETTYTADDQFLLGDALLVAPVTRPGIEHRHVYLPQGTWFHYWSGERFDGPAHILAHAPLGEPALYVRANTPIPFGPDASHTGERPPDPLTLRIHPAEGAGESTLYEDEGDGFGYEGGGYARRVVSCDTSHDRVVVRLGEREGSFVPERRQVILELRGIDAAQSVLVDGEARDPSHANGALSVSLGEEARAATVEVIL